MSAKCPRCGKTVYDNEAVLLANAKWHSKCVRCVGPGTRGPGGKFCHTSLDIRSAMVHKGKLYCKKCVPKPKHTTVSDDIMLMHQKQVQKGVEESKNSLQKGMYKGKFTTISDDVQMQHSLQAHKNITHSKQGLEQGVYKEKFTTISDDVHMKHALQADKNVSHSKQGLEKGMYKEKFTTISDDVQTQHALQADKNVSHAKESLARGEFYGDTSGVGEKKIDRRNRRNNPRN